MVIVWGTRLVGKTDVVPGMFYVTTSFGHINYLPLIPKESYVMLTVPGSEGHGVPLPTSWKSVLLAWARILLFLPCVIATGAAGGMFIDRTPGWLNAMAIAGAMWAAFWFIMWSKYCNHASARRAYELAEHIGLNERGMAQLAEIHGHPHSVGAV